MSHPSPPPSHPISFLQIIEADHALIAALALQLITSLKQYVNDTSSAPKPPNPPPSTPSTASLHPSSPVRTQSTPPPTPTPTTILTFLSTLTTHLIRHDISESLVMRPAFTHHLGSSGTAMSQHDETEHRNLKRSLLDLRHRLTSLLFPTPPNPNYQLTNPPRLPTHEPTSILHDLTHLSRKMKQHMDEETGGQLRQFASLITQPESIRLGNRYAETLCLMPDVELAYPIPIPMDFSHDHGDGDGDGGVARNGDVTTTTEGGAEGRKKVFPGGVDEYITRAGPEVYRLVMEAVRGDERYARYIAGCVEREVGKLGVTGDEGVRVKL